MAATHPEYSFVRLNEDGFNLSDCSPDISKCLPIQFLDDIKFQLITDFAETVAPSAQNFIVAFPCQDNADNAANVYTDVFTGAKDVAGIGRDATGVISGFVGAFSFTTTTPLGASIGDYVFISSTSVTGGTEIRGFSKIIFESGGTWFTDRYIAATPTALNVKAQLMPDGFILGTDSQLLPNNSEFSGTNYAWNINSATSTSIIYEAGDCFSLCVWKLQVDNSTSPAAFVSGAYLGSTNCFTLVSSNCYTTKLEYGCNEDAFGFYGQGFFNSIRLPLYLSRANYESDEKGYQKSDGTFVKLAERVNKTFELRTDWMPEQWHDRLRVALSCDTIQVTNENENLTQVAIYKKDEYEVDWDSEVDFPLAKGKAKVFKGLFRKSVNSNCV